MIKKRICEKSKLLEINGEVLAGVMRAGVGKNINLEKIMGNVRKNEAEKVGRQAIDAYEEKVKEIEEHKIPCLVEELNVDFYLYIDFFLRHFIKLQRKMQQLLLKKQKWHCLWKKKLLRIFRKKLKLGFRRLNKKMIRNLM